MTELLDTAQGAVSSALQDGLSPRNWVAQTTRDFIAQYRQHINLEERILLPMATEYLAVLDWQALKAKLREDGADRLFGPAIANKYAILHERLIEMEAELQAVARTS